MDAGTWLLIAAGEKRGLPLSISAFDDNVRVSYVALRKCLPVISCVLILIWPSENILLPCLPELDVLQHELDPRIQR